MAVPFQAELQVLRISVEAHLGARPQVEQSATAIPWKSGERLTATVDAALSGSRFLLRIGDRSFDVVLPLPAAVGDQLELEFLSSQPRLTFALRSGPEPAPPAPTSAPAPAAVDISPSARSLSTLLQTIGAAARAAGAGTSTGVEEPVPLLPAPPAASIEVTARLAAALRTSMERSGLFYESHLGAWLAGERPLSELLREPQGRLSQAAMPAAAETSDVQEPAPSARAAEMSARAQAAPASAQEEPVAAQLLPQVKAQLEALDSRQVVWQGQAWPGQRMEWRVDEPPERDPDSAEPVPWTTRVRLTLPHMGEITADLVLAAQTLRLRLASPAASQAVLRAGQGALAQALEHAGLHLSGFRVDDREPG